MKIVDHIPKGYFFIQKFVNFANFRLPAPIVPNFSQIPELLPDAIVIAIVTYAVTFSIGKLFGKKNKYRVDPRQVIVLFFEWNSDGSVFRNSEVWLYARFYHASSYVIPQV